MFMEIKTIDDYVQELKQKFPFVKEKALKQIIKFGWRSIYLTNTYGADVHIHHNKLWCYFGQLKGTPLAHFYYYINKLSKKLRILYKRKKIPWDGYYYFALSDKQYEDYLSQKKKRGRPRKHFEFGTVKLYKLKGECELKQFSSKHIFRVHYPIDLGYTMFKRNYKSDKAEFLYSREPMKFEDILTSNNNYGIL